MLKDLGADLVTTEEKLRKDLGKLLLANTMARYQKLVPFFAMAGVCPRRHSRTLNSRELFEEATQIVVLCCRH